MSANRRIFSLLALTSLCLGSTYAKTDTLHFEPTSTTVTTYHFQAVSSICVNLDLGYFINIKDTSDIEVNQNSVNGSDPFTTYYGCGQIDVLTTFPAIIQATVEPTSPAGGLWSATLDNKTDLPIEVGMTSVEVCVLGIEVQAQLLIADHSQENVPVAQITIQVIPQ